MTLEPQPTYAVNSTVTLDQFVQAISAPERQRIEAHINDLRNTRGYGVITFVFIDGNFVRWRFEQERKI